MTKTYLKYRLRITVLATFILVSWAGLCFRLFQVQILNGEVYQKAVIKQSQKKLDIPPARGNIFDRNNRSLTRNIIHYTLSVNPALVEKKEQLAKEISKIYENIALETIGHHIQLLEDKKFQNGEFVIIIPAEEIRDEDEGDKNILVLLDLLLDKKLSYKDSINIVSKFFKLNKNTLYKRFISLEKKTKI